jgi:GH24 family phage-related lysozyme (muramidase)
VTTRPIPPEAVEFIKQYEGVRLTAYRDVAGVHTIGYGHTGEDVHAGMTISEEDAEALLEGDLHEAAELLAKRVKPKIIDLLSDSQYAALLSFVFNLGAAPEWTIWRVLNEKKFDEVPVQMTRFVYARNPWTRKQIKVAGLVKRRAAEVELWRHDAEPVEIAARPAVTNPVRVSGKPIVQSLKFWGGLTAGSAGSAGIGEVLSGDAQKLYDQIDWTRVQNAVADIADTPDLTAKGLSGLSMLLAAVLLAMFLRVRQLEQRDPARVRPQG